jgi:hypothetical protein
VHEFQSILLAFGLEGEFDELVIEMRIDVFIGWTVDEFS